MRAIFFKELREHFRWALLAFAATGLALAWALSQATDPARYPNGGSLLAPAVVEVTTFAGAAFALLLALIQTWPERTPDRWALLVHRPVSRAAIFAGKAGAGLVLYLLAVGAPFLAAARWCFVPGHVTGPVVPGMMLPGAIDLAAGFLFYLAGFAVALRKARWSGTKALPLLGACAAFLAAHSSDFRVTFGLAAAMAALGGALLFVVARDAFLRHGLGEEPAPHARAALAGLAFLALFAAATGLRDAAFFLHGGNQDEWWSYQIGKAGQPLKVYERIGHGMIQTTRLSDLDDHPIPIEGTDVRAQTLPTASVALQAVPWMLQNEPNLREAQGYAWERYTDRRPNQETVTWYYVPFRGLMEGYNQRTRRLVGTLGPDGYAAGGAPNRPFDATHRLRTVWSGTLLAFPQGVFLVDPARRETRRAAGPDEAVRALSISSLRDDLLDGFDPGVRVVLGFPDGISVLDRDGRPVARLPHDPAFPPEQSFSVMMGIVPSADGDTYAVLYAPSYVETRKAGRRSWEWKPGALDRYDAAGALTSATPLPPLPASSDALPPWLYWFDLSFAAYQPVVEAAPGTGPWLCSRFPWFLVAGVYSLPTSLDDLREMPWSEWLVFALDAVLAALGARLAWRLLAGLPRRGRQAGTVLAFLLGPLAALALWLVRERPRTVPCPACGQGRKPEEERCAACGAPWPEPARDGREIFEREAVGV